MKKLNNYLLGILCLAQIACGQAADKRSNNSEVISSSKSTNDRAVVQFKPAIDTTTEFKILVPGSGRYQLNIYGENSGQEGFWIEDYIGNPDDRTYDISGKLFLVNGMATVDGSPLAKGEHTMRVHLPEGGQIDSILFRLIKPHRETPQNKVQSMSGDEWSLVWSDEFDEAKGLDTGKWDYNIGNWGWGNNELQYYTDENGQNVELKNGHLIIKAIKDEHGNWTSARLTTQSKISFTYGKIEFRARVPVNRGCWAAGWLLGDSYVDELSWPYCGEIDVLECVGYEIDDESGDGINHATCHTRKYYFKQGNQIGNQIAVENMDQEFHTYGIVWDSTEIKAYLDEEHYFTYDKNQDELEWPFNKPQNIIVNLAIGGGWGGAKGIDSSFSKAEYILDYIRVYEKQ